MATPVDPLVAEMVELLDADQREEFEERAGIIEFDGQLVPRPRRVPGPSCCPSPSSRRPPQGRPGGSQRRRSLATDLRSPAPSWSPSGQPR
jgi:hypothetical protein